MITIPRRVISPSGCDEPRDRTCSIRDLRTKRLAANARLDLMRGPTLKAAALAFSLGR
jgi:hypothetical protein